MSGEGEPVLQLSGAEDLEVAIVAGQFRRSSGLTTVPGSTVRPLP